ncbi:hypothetical protein BVRB_009780 [Beta vulgaris subsp. vulgaris]|uniref:Uncharacterized protein n=1 Tax=Beta vulgaris subsp. vulgaris TaxID=3555 RepID=A0A0J8B2D8_BETVV|nr:hypothetical protein BVRB_009780 [Beta vulgaris subsp. vulgaris]
MEPPSSFKDVLLSSSNVSNNATLAENVLSVAGASASLAGPVVGDALVADPVVPQFNPVRAGSKKNVVLSEGVDDSHPLVGIPESGPVNVSKGVVIKEPAEVPKAAGKTAASSFLPAIPGKTLPRTDTALDKGKGKLCVASPTVEISSDDEDSERLSSVLPISMVCPSMIETGVGDLGELDLPLVPALPPIKVFHTSHLFSESYYDDMLCEDEFAAALSPTGSAEKSGSGAFFLDLPHNDDDEIYICNKILEGKCYTIAYGMTVISHV